MHSNKYKYAQFWFSSSEESFQIGKFKRSVCRSLVLPFRQLFFSNMKKPILQNIKQIITRFVCTYLNAFLMVSPITVLKFNNFYIFVQFCDKFDLSSAQVCRMARANKESWLIRILYDTVASTSSISLSGVNRAMMSLSVNNSNILLFLYFSIWLSLVSVQFVVESHLRRRQTTPLKFAEEMCHYMVWRCD